MSTNPYIERLQELVESEPHKVAIEDGERLITRLELMEMSQVVASNLQQHGVYQGTTIGIKMGDSFQHLVLLVALIRCAAVISSISKSYSLEALKSELASESISLVVLDEGLSGPEEISWININDLFELPTSPLIIPDYDSQSPLFVGKSSGTTGEPKRFLRTSREFLLWIERYANTQEWQPSDRCLSLTNMLFNIGRSISLGMLYVGATVVINRAKEAEDVISLVNNASITYLKLAPVHLHALLALSGPQSPLMPGLRMAVVGSAPTSHATRLQARGKVTPNLCEQLGSNEAGLIAFARPQDQDEHPEAVGRVVPGVTAEVIDEQGLPLAEGTVGELRLKADGLPTCYVDNPGQSELYFRDGWFYPGDLASIYDGYLCLRGRADEVINNAGAKFYPVEVEDVIQAHPDVKEVAVAGMPHPKVGQVAVAFVVVKSQVSEQDLIQLCRSRLEPFKHPWRIVYLQDLPRNEMGKVVKSRLLEQLGDTNH